MLVAVSLGWAMLQTGRFLISPLLPTIIADLGITEATAGIALSIFGGAYALIQYPSGEYSDRWNRTTLIVPGLLVLAAGFALFGLTNGVVLFFVAATVVGIGKGLFAIPSRALLSDLFTKQRGRALGIYAAGTDAGGLISSGVAILALTYASWRTPFFPVAIGLGLLTAAYAATTRDGYHVGETSLDVSGTVGRLVESSQQRETLVAFSLFYFMVGGIINFIPTYLAQTKGFSQGLAGLTFAIVFAVGLAVKPLAGSLGDRFSRRGIAVAGLLVAATGLMALVVASATVAIWFTVAFLALGYKAGFPLADAIIVDDAPDGGMGADLGAARALFLGANAVGPAYVGIVATYGSYDLAFGGFVVCLLVAAWLLFRNR
ncbi:MFS transporter [Halobellus sp. Atlit-38R]|uniref:MFS transporter n=1 Tax=Halobellus sp. Atlit-38R TaxID=2282131 RepID=UPI000EF22460|nr:MFS transporter [Halobellus sp. Atlit-38R]RLM89393.1 MFS transporter [Halobellus sp. Atlit-38R]